jgi:hypothetical protein
MSINVAEVQPSAADFPAKERNRRQSAALSYETLRHTPAALSGGHNLKED